MESGILPVSGQLTTHLWRDKRLDTSDDTLPKARDPKSSLKDERTMSMNDMLNRDAEELPKLMLPPPTKTYRMTTISILEALNLMPADFYKLPKLRGGSPMLRWLRWRVASVYRRLFAIVWLANMIALAIYCYHHLRNGIALKGQSVQIKVLEDLQTAVAANLLATVSLRNEHIVNVLYRIFINNTPANRPLWLRRLLAKLYCNGGVHSGCGISAASWYLLLTVVALFNQPPSKAQAILLSSLSFFICALLIAMIACAMPCVRSKAHNLFELVHRFVGWTIQGLVWVQVVTFATVIAAAKNGNIGFALIKLPAFWSLCIIFGFTLYPWLRLRRVKVRVEKLSKHAVRIWFDGRIKPIRTIRLSNSPLTETHAFATIPEPSGQMGFSTVVSNAGDWTKRFIANPPDKIWVRGLYAWGVLRIGTMFRKIVVVTTGSGIGPCLSLFSGHPEVPCRILWSTRNPEETYGKRILESVLRIDPNALIIDTKEKGRQDMVQLSYNLYRESNAEAVVVISNPALTYSVVFGLESRGIPAYGPIWDS